MKMTACVLVSLCALAGPVVALAAEAEEVAAIKSLLQQYRATQDSGDLIAQSKLMTPTESGSTSRAPAAPTTSRT